MSVFGFFGRTFSNQISGQPIRVKTLNGPIDAINDLHRRRVSSGLVSIEVAGIQNERRPIYDETYARLISAVGSSGAYTWRGITGQKGSPGAWVDLPASISDRSGADLAYEQNQNPNLVAGTRVFLKREDTTGAYVFPYDTCSTIPRPSVTTRVAIKTRVGPTPRGLFATKIQTRMSFTFSRAAPANDVTPRPISVRSSSPIPLPASVLTVRRVVSGRFTYTFGPIGTTPILP